jgi:hypothetical protein
MHGEGANKTMGQCIRCQTGAGHRMPLFAFCDAKTCPPPRDARQPCEPTTRLSFSRLTRLTCLSRVKQFWSEIDTDRLFKFSLLPLTLLVTLVNANAGGGTQIGLPCVCKCLFGIECPGCGMSRSIMALWQGQWAQAYAFNKLGLLAFAVIAWMSARETFTFFNNHKGISKWLNLR